MDLKRTLRRKPLKFSKTLKTLHICFRGKTICLPVASIRKGEKRFIYQIDHIEIGQMNCFLLFEMLKFVKFLFISIESVIFCVIKLQEVGKTFFCEQVFLLTNLSFENAGAELRVGCHHQNIDS